MDGMDGMDGMSGMDMGGSSDTGSSSSSGMAMGFTTSTTTPLFSLQWTPRTSGAYAGTCIFLVVLAVIFRALLALRSNLNRRALDRDRRRRYVVVAGDRQARNAPMSNTPTPTPTPGKRLEDMEDDEEFPDRANGGDDDSSSRDAVLVGPRGAEEKVRVLAHRAAPVMPWRFSTDLPRALLLTVVAGVGYLLMLAVMTMNVGYFMSILAGTFVGDLAIGRFGAGEEH